MRLLLPLLAALSCASAADLRFQAAGGGEFKFDTGVLRGTLRAGGKSLGLTSVVHIPSGATISRSYGLVSHYRVFTANKRYGGGAWDWPSQAAPREDGSVEVHWPAAPPGRPFEMWAVYRWAAADTLDIETRVRAETHLAAFESFLASYFAPQFTSSAVYARERGKAKFLAAEQSEGVWQMFPRDRQAVAMIGDGRWKILPSPVDWVIRPPLAQPIGMRRDAKAGVTVIIMAPPQDCFAVATPHQAEGHYSLYLALFGRAIQAGETARARARLVVATSLADKQVLRLYRSYLKHLNRS